MKNLIKNTEAFRLIPLFISKTIITSHSSSDLRFTKINSYQSNNVLITPSAKPISKIINFDYA